MIVYVWLAGADMNALADVSDYDGRYTGLRLTPLHLSLWHSRFPPASLSSLDTDALESPAWALLNLGTRTLVVRTASCFCGRVWYTGVCVRVCAAGEQPACAALCGGDEDLRAVVGRPVGPRVHGAIWHICVSLQPCLAVS